MTSLGCNQDTEINRDRGGPFVFRVQGRLYHWIGSLLPQPESSPVYAQLYIYDPQEALEFCMNNTVNASLDRATMQTLQDMLYRRHPGGGKDETLTKVTTMCGWICHNCICKPLIGVCPDCGLIEFDPV